jgi:hypothetical protein
VRVEVKGTRGKGKAILLTEGEVANARNANGYTVDLFILSDVRVEIFPDGTVTTSGGNTRTIEDWKPSDEHLTAPHYYREH